MLLIKNIEVFSPENMGIKDVLITNGKITLIEDKIQSFSEKIEMIDGTGKNLYLD